eukprot:5564401-Pyramimonas_sp.AAC.1
MASASQARLFILECGKQFRHSGRGRDGGWGATKISISLRLAIGRREARAPKVTNGGKEE